MYSNLWVALSMGAVSYSVQALNHIHKPSTILLNIALAFLSYNYIYWTGYFSHPFNMNEMRIEWMKKHHLVSLSMSLLAIVYILLKSISFTPIQWLIILALAVLTLFYILPSQKAHGIRWLPGIKIIIIAFSWTTLIVTFHWYSILAPNALISQNLMIFLIIIALTIPFDLRDINSDIPQLKTVPQIIGVKNSIRLSQFLFVTAGIILFFLFQQTAYRIINLSFIVLCSGIVSRSSGRSANFYLFWLEGLPILWGLTLLFIL